MDWQTIVALLIVSMAIVLIARNFLGSLRAVGTIGSPCGSGGCSTCPSNEQNTRAPKRIELVHLESETTR